MYQAHRSLTLAAAALCIGACGSSVTTTVTGGSSSSSSSGSSGGGGNTCGALLPLGTSNCSDSPACCQTGDGIPVGGGCVNELGTSSCVARCNSNDDCSNLACCVPNPSSIPAAGQAPSEPGGWCLTGNPLCMPSGSTGNGYVCTGNVTAGYSCLPQAPTASTGGCSWTGTWKTTSDGTMTLVQNGDAVSGDYSDPPGQFQGTVGGSTVSGRWTQLSSDGECPNGPQTMTLGADCTSFTGTFYYCTTSGGSGSVNGTRE
jgi:hypothetical protein